MSTTQAEKTEEGRILTATINKFFGKVDITDITKDDEYITATWADGAMALPLAEIELIRTGRSQYIGAAH